MIAKRAQLALVADLVAVIAFVAIGRRSHHEPGNVLVGIAKVAAPFLIAVIVGWLASRAWRDPLSNVTGASVWLTTVIVGLLLRHFAFDRGTATAFVIVTTATVAVFILGWRGIARWRLANSEQPPRD